MADGTCPACRKNVDDTSGLNPDLALLRVKLGERLPPVCFRCGAPATEYFAYRVEETPPDESEYQITRILTFLAALLLGIFFWRWRTKARLVVYLPRCKACRNDSPSLHYINFREGWISLIVHRGLRDAMRRSTSDAKGVAKL
jgi:hypothetical protein